MKTLLAFALVIGSACAGESLYPTNVNVRGLGAKGDGVEGDTAALQIAAERPLLRIGAMSDNHLHPDRSNTLERFPASGGNVEYGVGAPGRIYTMGGTYGSHRYAWRISKSTHSDDELCLVIREGEAGRFKVNSVTCFAVSAGPSDLQQVLPKRD